MGQTHEGTWESLHAHDAWFDHGGRVHHDGWRGADPRNLHHSDVHHVDNSQLRCPIIHSLHDGLLHHHCIVYGGALQHRGLHYLRLHNIRPLARTCPTPVESPRTRSRLSNPRLAQMTSSSPFSIYHFTNYLAGTPRAVYELPVWPSRSRPSPDRHGVPAWASRTPDWCARENGSVANGSGLSLWHHNKSAGRHILPETGKGQG
jgi:hypothetical protein